MPYPEYLTLPKKEVHKTITFQFCITTIESAPSYPWLLQFFLSINMDILF